ncbi:UPF0280 family protein [Methanococcus aeolicus]|uniref:UPF0280 protein Maeo_0343 n=1 Tax=Methanococcus aeolicus (strain ATCC BAA-1280 / DSM 17508 / OCM 812 / Nankai-3) TaxID=419665 RepID=Y343_META3|nr:UPF0280 family protein [Methanococcus aeolicus]A6UTV8.1 RecName: Full=UPF0280 protein Maeo_0343 [Methanococcus aeolicus Nankai-3]ABR55930.1 protein of unknown function DUF375 [Methanococcus aeolicus Nankai-3]UXM85471.1 UPF0280 family protein [Methanococcus aeolicus]
MIHKKISIMETNINLKVDDDKYINLAKNTILRERANIQNYILDYPEFLTSYTPIKVSPDAPAIVKTMAKAGEIAAVGPMASVAGTISEFIVKNAVEYGCKNIISENGGDIALKTEKSVVVGLYAGSSPLSYTIGFKINEDKANNGYGVCTSSGTVGHSVSFGNADAIVVFAKKASIADASATSIGNFAVGAPDDAINKCLEKAEDIEYIDGVFVVMGEFAGKMGKIPQMVKTDEKIVKTSMGEYFDMI